MSIVLQSTSGGSVTIQEPATASNFTQTLPAATGNVVLDSTAGVCRAWVNFNGTGTVAIRASFNVSSITDNGTGDYTVNFTTAMPDANYSYTGSCNIGTANYNILLTPNRTTAPTSSAFRFVTASSQDGTFYDCAYVNVAAFR